MFGEWRAVSAARGASEQSQLDYGTRRNTLVTIFYLISYLVLISFRRTFAVIILLSYFRS